jgi:hypothetical protein
MKDEMIEAGQHCWAISAGKLLVVLKIEDGWYEVCGAWECGIGAEKIEIISIIDRPADHLSTKLYYL